MNDPNKAIEVNLSSLLSLKAEVLRKQAEVSKAKAIRVLPEDFTPNKISSSKKLEKCLDKRQNKTIAAIVCEYEDPALLEKSQKTLEAKSKYYDRMTRCETQQTVDENCLVLFHHKQREDLRVLSPPKHSSSGSETDDDDDWVEYIDCLGRTRKCLHKDLEEMKKRDKDLAASIPERLDQSKPNWMLDLTSNKSLDSCNKQIGLDPPESVVSEGLSIISKHDEMRINWGKKQEENLDKPNVHYQDVFFDEARQHGVGYYAFSTDEAERVKQQSELTESRKQTIAEQEKREQLRVQREKIIAERVRAAKNRQRARLGLPPLFETDTSDINELNEKAKKNETKEDRRERKLLEKLKRKQEKLAATQELERKHHLRPWDKGKDGINAEAEEPQEEAVPIEWHYKPERLPMSQAEWNEHKRAERNPDFAPILSNAKHSNFRTIRTNFESTSKNKSPNVDLENFQCCNTSKKFQSRSYQINNGDYKNDLNEDAQWPRGVAIPPPSDLVLQDEYQKPPCTKKSKTNIELERSIEAGLRFLRNNSDKNTMGVKSSWAANADY